MKPMVRAVWVKTITLFSLWRLLLLILAGSISTLAPLISTYVPDESFGRGLPYLGYIWANMDGFVFLVVAHQGYSAAELPFFPLYPLLTRAIHLLTFLPWIYAGMTVSLLSSLWALWMSWLLLKEEKAQRQWWWFLVVLLLFPTAYSFTAVYNDALFYALATTTLWLGRRKSWYLALITAFLAGLARLTGVALAVFLAVEFLLQIEPRIQRSWLSIPRWFSGIKKSLKNFSMLPVPVAAACAAPAAFLSYLAWIQYRFGDWQLFIRGAEVWHRDHAVLPLQTIWRYINILVLHSQWNFVYAVAWGEFLFTIFYGLVLLLSWQKLRFSYWAFMITALTIPMVTGTLQGMPRYGLHLFPLFFVVSGWLSREKRWWLRASYIAVSSVLLLAYLTAFTRGYFVT